MCYAIPAKVLETTGDVATVDYGGVKKKANISLVEKLNVGDYILIHAGFAIEKLDPGAAEYSLKIFRNFTKEAEKR
ncbi:MAG: HypC/HybG/HupF family hydrogenase formation chaperone [Candidatus Micrarchaeota archaeon]